MEANTAKKHPDFNEWIKTEEGIKCVDYASLSSEEYLKNRLFWAFDAGRNCVWEQYINQKKEIEILKKQLENKKP